MSKGKEEREGRGKKGEPHSSTAAHGLQFEDLGAQVQPAKGLEGKKRKKSIERGRRAALLGSASLRPSPFDPSGAPARKKRLRTQKRKRKGKRGNAVLRPFCLSPLPHSQLGLEKRGKM